MDRYGRETAGMLGAGGPGEGQGVMRTVHPGPMSDNEAGFTTAGETRSLVLSPTLLFLPPPVRTRIRVLRHRAWAGEKTLVRNVTLLVGFERSIGS